ncbi:hypothetical protein FVW20_02820 [Desulfovibrio oxamicus]|uniref:DUF2939 domain-containing protein n=1 Tax=Nitratidesulfovibrio oxamicus TaxID=32016 RepID=A0ABS0J0R5_9BACT|nr:hypothetical protein [Nitratidesulfovibrio oxamicus]MBG3875984.1 hypothetical protein [Nitratidesulfovibrio oxamicus]
MGFSFKLPFLSRKKKSAGGDLLTAAPESLDGAPSAAPGPATSKAAAPKGASASPVADGPGAAPGKRKGLSKRTLRLVLYAVAGLVVLGGAAGGGWWWIKANSPETAVEQLALAFRNGDATAFERRVDLDRVVDQLMEVQLKASGVQGTATPDARETAQLRDVLRQALLALPVGAAGERKREDLLPPDFREQVGAFVPVIAERNGDRAVVSVPVKNEALETTFDLRVEMIDGKDGWKVTGLVDPDGQLAAHAAALERIRARERAAAAEENARIAERLAGLVRLDRTLVGIDTLSGGRNFKTLVIQVTGANQSTQTLGRVVVDCAVRDEAGRVLRTLKLVRGMQIRPGEAFAESWVIDLDEAEPKDVPLLNAERLTGQSTVRSVVLATGESIVIKGE